MVKYDIYLNSPPADLLFFTPIAEPHMIALRKRFDKLPTAYLIHKEYIRLIFHLKNLSFLFLFSAIFIFSSCVNYNLHYEEKAALWPSNKPNDNLPIEHTIFLIGDAGGAHPGEDKQGNEADVQPALKFLKKKLSEANKNSTVVFLGDNIYPNGMAPKSDTAERTMDEFAIKAQLSALENFQGQTFFIAGNHDWYKHGLSGVKRQKKYLDAHLGKEDVLLPKPGCGDPVEVEINDNLTLVLLDSQWWLEDWSKDPEINDGCEAQSREVFSLHLQKVMRDHRDKNVVVALHHPLYTKGPHGGQFNLKQHLFPLTEKWDNLWIPFPFIGSIYPMYRSTFGSKQDLVHPDYQSLKDLLIEAAMNNGHYIFASGHEHSLQYIEKDGQSFIVSGSGTKKSPTKLGDGWKFAYGDRGFAQLDFYQDGTVWLQFWAAKENGSDGIVVYRQQIKGPLQKIEQRALAEKMDYPFYESKTGKVTRSLNEQDFSKSKVGEFLLGKHYRDVYKEPLEIPVLHLDTFHNGVTPVKMGGGFQTNSLRLQTKSGKQYTMRSVDKDATRTVPYQFIGSFVPSLLKDYFTSAHPLSALPVPILADAVGVYHTNPKLYYIPKQPALMEFNEDYGDALYLVEERPNDKVWSDQASFGEPQNIRSTSKMLEKVLEKPDRLVDQRSVLKARLFDILLGDWDRHEDQWRWAEFDRQDSIIYRPIPRDRDQAFSNYDGFLSSIIRPLVPYSRQLRTYEGDLKKLKWSSYNARQFDRAYLTGMEWEDWQEEALFIQNNLTDEVIDSAFKESWPASIYKLGGASIGERLKKRRDALSDNIRPLYETLAKKVDVLGTEGRDLFVINRFAKITEVRVYDTNKEGDKQRLIYHRDFLSKETQQINIYGLDGQDIFEVSGSSSIKVRLIGGLGKDIYRGDSPGQNIIFDTEHEENIYEIHAGNRLKISNDPKYITYNRKSKDYETNFGTFLPSIAFNPDDGVLLGLNASYTSYGFKKEPYAVKHNLSGAYALETSGLRLKYSSEFIEAVGNWNLELNAIFQSPLYSTNFYGLGNATSNLEETFGNDYHRVRQQQFEFSHNLSNPSVALADYLQARYLNPSRLNKPKVDSLMNWHPSLILKFLMASSFWD